METYYDLTEEFFTLTPGDFNSHIRSLGEGAIGAISFTLDTDNNEQVMRKAKACLERGSNRVVAVVASKDDVAKYPNEFTSGIIRIDSDY